MGSNMTSNIVINFRTNWITANTILTIIFNGANNFLKIPNMIQNVKKDMITLKQQKF